MSEEHKDELEELTEEFDENEDEFGGLDDDPGLDDEMSDDEFDEEESGGPNIKKWAAIAAALLVTLSLTGYVGFKLFGKKFGSAPVAQRTAPQAGNAFAPPVAERPQPPSAPQTAPGGLGSPAVMDLGSDMASTPPNVAPPSVRPPAQQQPYTQPGQQQPQTPAAYAQQPYQQQPQTPAAYAQQPYQQPQAHQQPPASQPPMPNGGTPPAHGQVQGHQMSAEDRATKDAESVIREERLLAKVMDRIDEIAAEKNKQSCPSGNETNEEFEARMRALEEEKNFLSSQARKLLEKNNFLRKAEKSARTENKALEAELKKLRAENAKLKAEKPKTITSMKQAKPKKVATKVRHGLPHGWQVIGLSANWIVVENRSIQESEILQVGDEFQGVKIVAVNVAKKTVTTDVGVAKYVGP